jgi:sortase A
VALPPQRPTANQSNEVELLESLLATELPNQRSSRRTPRLRSVSSQQREALKPFLTRTWVDHTLRVVERALVVLVLIVFVHWLFDGFGRDWLYTLRGGAPVEAVAASVPTAVRQLQPDTAPPAVAPELPALPFTTPDMAVEPPAADYLAPQPILEIPVAADPRPQRIAIPALELDAVVREVFVVDGAWQVAAYAVGYHHGSALPGADGNTVMAGHAGLRGAVFRYLGRLQPGDEIRIDTGGWRYTYVVREQLQVWPTQVEVMAPTPTPVLTLITCTNWDTQRLIVIADLVDARPLA